MSFGTRHKCLLLNVDRFAQHTARFNWLLEVQCWTFVGALHDFELVHDGITMID